MIDTAALELKIIELAMMGRLTHQNASEQADSFYDEIVSLRDKYQKEGIIAKVKPMADIKEEEKLFSIPNNWRWVRINEVLDVVMGQSPQGTSVSVDFEGMEFHQGKIYFTEKFLNDSKQRTCEITKIAKANSVLLCVRAPVGVVNIVEREICIGRGLCAISSYSDIDPLFIFYYLKICKKQFEMQGTGSTFSAITVDTVKKQLIPLPPKEEMQRIVDVLEKTFAIIKTIENAQQQYSSDIEILKSKIIDAGIQGKLTEQLPDDRTAEELLEQIAEEKKLLIKEKKIKVSKELPEIIEDEIPFAIPDNWKWCRLVDLCREVTDGTHKTPTYIETGIPFLSVKNVSSGHFDFEDVKYISESEHRELIKRCNPEKGDILFCRIGTLGKAIEIDFSADFSIFVSLGLIKPLDSYLSKYLVYVLNSGFGEKWIKKNKAGDAMHAAKINLDVLRSFLIPLPPLLEQTRIVDKIDEMLSIVQR